MKCVKQTSTGKIVRMNDKAAYALVSKGKAKFVPKHKWREGGRKR